MKYVRAFGRFWWNFIVGDDWRVAAGVALALGLRALLTHHGVNAWWLLPARGRAADRDLRLAGGGPERGGLAWRPPSGHSRAPPPAERRPAAALPLPRGWILFGLALLALNFYLGSRATEPAVARPRPVQPVLPERRCSAGHVKEITSKGTAIQGTFTKKLTLRGARSRRRGSGPRFPAFADNDALSHLLEQKGVVVNAEPLDTGPPWWQSLLLGFGPTLLFLVPAVLADAPRRERAERARLVRPLAGAPLPAVGRPGHVRRRRRDRRGEGRS